MYIVFQSCFPSVRPSARGALPLIVSNEIPSAAQTAVKPFRTDDGGTEHRPTAQGQSIVASRSWPVASGGGPHAQSPIRRPSPSRVAQTGRAGITRPTREL